MNTHRVVRWIGSLLVVVVTVLLVWACRKQQVKPPVVKPPVVSLPAPPPCKEQHPGLCFGVPPKSGRLWSIPPAIKAYDLRLNPPRVKHLRVLPADNPKQARVELEMVPDPRLARGLTLRPDSRPFTLLDDGKGADRKAGDWVFSYKVDVPFDSLRTQEQAARKKSGNAAIPEFVGRRILGLRKIDPEVLAGGFEVFVPPTARLDHASVLMITDHSVVRAGPQAYDPCTGTGNPNGKWTFKHLMTQMANQSATGVDPTDFAVAWFNQWRSFSFPPSNLWPEMDRDAAVDLNTAPFRLLAIVNRIDLASNSLYGPSSGAELRFIFRTCLGQPRLFIIEYGVPRHTCTSLKQWAEAWVALDEHPLGSAAYNTALEALTDEVTESNAAPLRPNGSALNQLRTNAFTDSGGGFSDPGSFETWNLAEWQLTTPGRLTRVDVAQTPRSAFNETEELASWINHFEVEILAEKHTVGAFFEPFDPTLPFSTIGVTTKRTLVDEGPPEVMEENFWQAPGISNNDARHLFSLTTCDGCHMRETNTDFQHVFEDGSLSGFLTGISVADPVTGTVRAFDDLERRAQALATIAESGCFSIGFEPRLPLSLLIRPLLSPH